MDDEVRARLADLVRELSGVPASAIHDGARLDDELGLDSLSVAELYAAAEREFRIRVAPEDARRCEDFGAVAALVCAEVARGGVTRRNGAR
jgi:acyl carrier protein